MSVVPIHLADGGEAYVNCPTPWASWPDEIIIEWARAFGLDRYPTAKVQLAAVAEHLAGIGEICFRTRNGFSHPTLIRHPTIENVGRSSDVP
jgi:hypothetical protein